MCIVNGIDLTSRDGTQEGILPSYITLTHFENQTFGLEVYGNIHSQEEWWFVSSMIVNWFMTSKNNFFSFCFREALVSWHYCSVDELTNKMYIILCRILCCFLAIICYTAILSTQWTGLHPKIMPHLDWHKSKRVRIDLWDNTQIRHSLP